VSDNEMIVKYVRHSDADLRLALQVGQAYSELCSTILGEFVDAMKRSLETSLAADGYVITAPPTAPKTHPDELLHIARPAWKDKTWIALGHEWGERWINGDEAGLFVRVRQPNSRKTDTSLSAVTDALRREFGGRGPSSWSAWYHSLPLPYGDRRIEVAVSALNAKRDEAVAAVSSWVVAVTKAARKTIGAAIKR
jgi:hypothetical protein